MWLYLRQVLNNISKNQTILNLSIFKMTMKTFWLSISTVLWAELLIFGESPAVARQKVIYSLHLLLMMANYRFYAFPRVLEWHSND